MNDKLHLRSEMKQKINAQNGAEKTLAAQKITANLQQFIEDSPKNFQRAAIFLATAREPNLDVFARWLQARGVLVCAPHSRESEKPFASINNDWSNISLNTRGWREPSEYSGFQQMTGGELDLILVPALAFDENGARLGKGGGWYDRALQNLPARALTIGVAFDFQIIESVPREAHDQSVSVIVTDKRILEIV